MQFKILFFCFLLFFNVSTIQAEDDPVGDIISETIKGAFDELDKRIIKAHYGGEAEDKYKNKHKKKKQKHLPPGIVKKLERGGSLPPGIAKRDLPHDLKKKIKEPPEGYEHIIVGNDILSVKIDTNEVIDIIKGVVLN